jgi:hypothetical protein
VKPCRVESNAIHFRLQFLFELMLSAKNSGVQEDTKRAGDGDLVVMLLLVCCFVVALLACLCWTSRIRASPKLLWRDRMLVNHVLNIRYPPMERALSMIAKVEVDQDLLKPAALASSPVLDFI